MTPRQGWLAPLWILALTCAGCEPSTDPPRATKDSSSEQSREAESVGTATMLPDGTIVLDLRTLPENGRRGEARAVYPPSHPQYPEILRHLDGLAPGQSKPVPPF